VTEPVVEAVGERTDLLFEPIGQVQLKGFREPTPLYIARPPD
jgi:class 3 adenylate cyclase